MISPKKAFALGVESFRQFMGGDNCDPQWSKNLDRLKTDIRMQGVWETLNGDQKQIEQFHLSLFSAWAGALPRNVDDLRGERASLLHELCEVEAAIEVISRYCATTNGEIPQHLHGLEPKLRELSDFARWRRTFREEHLIDPFLPTSRKSRADFLVRIHVPRLMVRDMYRLFGKPHYDLVAETLNVFFDFTEESSLTADNVRDAWRRHGRAEKMKRAIPITK